MSRKELATLASNSWSNEHPAGGVVLRSGGAGAVRPGEAEVAPLGVGCGYRRVVAVIAAAAVVVIGGLQLLDARTASPVAAPGGRSVLGVGGLGHLTLPTLPEPAGLSPATAAVAPTPPPPEGLVAEPAPAPAPPKQLRQDAAPARQGGTWAVLVGIDDYPGTAYDLKSAVADAAEVDGALGRLGVPGENRLVLRNGQATAGNIRAALDWLVGHAGPDAVAVFFYAGHVRKVGSNQSDTEAMVTADNSTVTDATLAQSLKRLVATRAWIAVAACYGGGFTEVAAPGRVLTAAAPADELAYENQDFGRSYLVEYMVRRAIVQQKAAASVQTAFDYARSNIAKDYPSRAPVQFDWGTAPLDLRPGPPPASSPPPPPPSSKPPAKGGGTPSPGTQPSTPPTTAPQPCSDVGVANWGC